MQKVIHPVSGYRERNGTFRDNTFHGYEYEEGWFIQYRSRNCDTQTALWIDGSFSSPNFHTTSQPVLNGLDPVEIEIESIGVAVEDRIAILGMLWEWEVWEPVTKAGTCAIECLERMLELSRDVLLEWFRTAGRNPSSPEDIVLVLQANGYAIESAGPEGFGRFRDFRRLVTMFRKEDPTNGHVVLIYEDDRDIFDASRVFKKVSDIIFSSTLGYDRGPVWKIEKV